ncbi:MAG: ABC transporter [Pseudolabrys sp.]
MPGLVPGIHVLTAAQLTKDVDGRDKPGHDKGNCTPAAWRAFRF